MWFRCRQEYGERIVAIPEWMCDFMSSQMRRADQPVVCVEALRELNELLASAPRVDRITEEPQRLEGGADEKDPEGKTRTVGIVCSPSLKAGTQVGDVACRGQAEDHAIAIANAAQLLGEASRGSGEGGGE